MADNDEDFGAMLAEFDSGKPKSATKRPRVGDQIKGVVASIGKDSVFVDVGGKAEGVLERSQVSDAENNLKIKLGDTVEARVVADAGGVLQLRVKLGRGPEARAELAQAQELGIPVEGLVTEVVKGGLSVDIAGVRAFCPASQIDARFVDDLAPFVGQRLTFKVTRYEPGPRGNLVVSRRALIEEENAKLAEVTRAKLVPGAVLRGKVTGFKPFGAFVDIGGIEGMLHVSELGHARVERPEDVLSLGQEVDVAVLKIEPSDKGERISLSLKALADDPWQDAVAKLPVGLRTTGKVTRLAQFGAFVELAPGIDGLVHISELGKGKRINHAKDAVEVGQQLEVSVLAIDAERHRIALGLGNDKDANAEEVASVTKAQSSASAKLGTLADMFARLKR